VGNGKQYVLSVDPQGIGLYAAFDSRDGLYDCTWSEENENILLSGCGDGSLKIWDIQARGGRPLQNYHEHTKEVYSVDWNLISKGKKFST
jgi:peroxin-7